MNSLQNLIAKLLWPQEHKLAYAIEAAYPAEDAALVPKLEAGGITQLGAISTALKSDADPLVVKAAGRTPRCSSDRQLRDRPDSHRAPSPISPPASPQPRRSPTIRSRRPSRCCARSDVTLASLLAPLVVADGDAGANALIDHKDAIVAALRAYETKDVDALEADLLAAILLQTISERAVYGEVTATIRTSLARSSGRCRSTTTRSSTRWPTGSLRSQRRWLATRSVRRSTAQGEEPPSFGFGRAAGALLRFNLTSSGIGAMLCG